jgi:hypothetical protein
MSNRLINAMLKPMEWFYPSAKAMYMWRMKRTFKSAKDAPILVLQMGKVGSKSVQAGLEAISLDRPIYHAHFLSQERTARTEKQRRKFFRTEKYSYLRRPWLNQFLLDTFRNDDSGPKWKLITLTREPVGRNISAFFENLEVVPLDTEGEFEISSDYYRIEPTVVSIDQPQQLAKLFFERATHDSPLKFFDREIRDIFGIDVLADGFSPAKGYGIYSSDRAEILVLRLESLADCADEAFKEFLGIDNFQIINRNIGSKKVYAPLYDAFKKHAVIDAGYATKLYDSRFMHTFYDDGEIAAARARWGIGDAA